MRTTLTLDPDVAELVRDAVHRDRQSMKVVVNEALRAALKGDSEPEPYRQRVHHSRLRPGVDVARLNQLADDLADEDQIASLVAR